MFRNRIGQPPRRDSGQSTVEYILLVTAVVGVIIIFTFGQNSTFQQKMSNMLENGTQGMQERSEFLDTTHNTTDDLNSRPNTRYTFNPKHTTVF